MDDGQQWMAAAQPNLSVLPGDTANEGETHIRLFVKKFVTIQPCHCEPFFGEAISRLSGQLDRLGIASSQRTLLAMTNTTVLMQD